jgi:hypothetical protein
VRFVGVLGNVDGLVSFDLVIEAVDVVGEYERPELEPVRKDPTGRDIAAQGNALGKTPRRI